MINRIVISGIVIVLVILIFVLISSKKYQSPNNQSLYSTSNDTRGSGEICTDNSQCADGYLCEYDLCPFGYHSIGGKACCNYINGQANMGDCHLKSCITIVPPE